MVYKLAALIVGMGLIACVLLGIRQLRVQAAHEMANVLGQIRNAGASRSVNQSSIVRKCLEWRGSPLASCSPIHTRSPGWNKARCSLQSFAASPSSR